MPYSSLTQRDHGSRAPGCWSPHVMNQLNASETETAGYVMLAGVSTKSRNLDVCLLKSNQ